MYFLYKYFFIIKWRHAKQSNYKVCQPKEYDSVTHCRGCIGSTQNSVGVSGRYGYSQTHTLLTHAAGGWHGDSSSHLSPVNPIPGSLHRPSFVVWNTPMHSQWPRQKAKGDIQIVLSKEHASPTSRAAKKRTDVLKLAII